MAIKTIIRFWTMTRQEKKMVDNFDNRLNTIAATKIEKKYMTR